MADAVIRVEVTDLATGEKETQEVGPDDYLILCTSRRFVSHVNRFGNGTVILTTKLDDPG